MSENRSDQWITLDNLQSALIDLGKHELSELSSSLWRLTLFLPKLIRRLRG